MANLFVPYIGEQPAAVVINGHRLVILSAEKDSLEDNLDLVGGDQVKEMFGGDTPEEQELILAELATAVAGGVVIAPVDSEVIELIEELQNELPWLH